MELSKGFEPTKGNKLGLTVRLTETDMFEKFMRICVEIFTDERIDIKARKEYENKFHEIINNWGDQSIQCNMKAKEFEKLKYACEKVVALLRHDENYNPHMTVIINTDEIKVVSDEMRILLK